MMSLRNDSHICICSCLAGLNGLQQGGTITAHHAHTTRHSNASALETPSIPGTCLFQEVHPLGTPGAPALGPLKLLDGPRQLPLFAALPPPLFFAASPILLLNPDCPPFPQAAPLTCPQKSLVHHIPPFTYHSSPRPRLLSFRAIVINPIVISVSCGALQRCSSSPAAACTICHILHPTSPHHHSAYHAANVYAAAHHSIIRETISALLDFSCSKTQADDIRIYDARQMSASSHLF